MSAYGDTPQERCKGLHHGLIRMGILYGIITTRAVLDT